MHMWHGDVMYDVTASFNGVMSANKVTCFRRDASRVHPHQIAQNWCKKDESNMVMEHPGRWEFCAMPHIYQNLGLEVHFIVLIKNT